MDLIIRILIKLIDAYYYILIIYALLSWFPGARQSKLGEWIGELVEPVVSVFRRLPLQFGGLDFSILFVLILMNWLTRFLYALL